MSYALFQTQQVQNSTGISFILAPSTTKMSIAISGWPFLNPSNSLAIRFLLTTYPPIAAINYQGIDGQGLQIYSIASPPSITSTIRFLSSAVADGTTNVAVGVSFQGLSGMTLTFPHFGSSIEYDPDLAVTLNTEEDSSNNWYPYLASIAAVIPLACCLLAVAMLVYLVVKRQQNKSLWNAKLHEAAAINQNSI